MVRWVHKRKLPWTDDEIVISYRQARNPLDQIKVLSELNACSQKEIVAVLERRGILPKKTKHHLTGSGKELRERLYEAGWGDKEIAGELGVTVQAVRCWRYRYNLPINCTCKKE